MSIGGVACAVLLILIVTSLYRGWSAAAGVFGELPGDIWVAQAGTSDPLRTTSFLPAAALDELSQVPGVRAIVPVYARRISLRSDGRELNVFFMSLAVPSPRRGRPRRGRASSPIPVE